MAATGFRLWGMVDAGPGPASVAHLADLRLGEQDEVERRFGDRRRDRTEGAGEVRDPGPFRMPRSDRLAQPQLVREEPHDRRSILTERRERARGAPQLDRKALAADDGQSLGGRVQTGQPDGGLRPERRRDRLLEERPPGHDRRAVGVRQAGGGIGRAVEVLEDGRTGTGGDEHRRRVQDVLARRAAVDVGRRRAADRPRQRLDQRHDRIAAGGRRPTDRRDVERLDAAGASDRLGVLGRDDAGSRFGAGERRLDLEHRPEPHLVAERGRRGSAGQDRVEQAAGRLRHRRRPSRVRPAAGCRSE